MARSQSVKDLILEHLRERKWSLALASVCVIGAIGMQLLGPWPLKVIFDHLLLHTEVPPHLAFLNPLLQGDTLVALTVVGSAIFIVAMLSGVFAYLQMYITTRIGFELAYVIRRAVFSRLQQYSMSFHNHARSGELLIKVSGDTSALKDLCSEWALTSVAHVLLLIGIVTVMFAVNWQLSLIVFGTLPILIGVLAVLNRRIKLAASDQRRHEGHMAARLNEVLGTMSLVQAFGRQAYEEQRFEEASSRNLEGGIRSARATAAVSRAIALVSAAGTAVTVVAGSWQVMHGRLTPGELLVFVAYLKSLYKPIRDIGKFSVKFSRASVSMQRLDEILRVQPEVQDRADAVEVDRLDGAIAFRNVSFAYQDSPSVLRDVSFEIAPGERVAVVGPSGAGKSTIVHLLLRLYEAQSGGISVDGRDIRDYKRDALRREIGIVLQDTVLFGATIRENIAYGKPDATSAEIEAAARDAYAHEFIMELALGYETVLGERGCTLSGGQRQRICLARALIRRPSILVLDEPTSAVDPVSARLIGEAVKRVHAGKTTLVISHELSALYDFDKILVVRDGTIVESGHHDQLIAAKGHYYQLTQRRSA